MEGNYALEIKTLFRILLKFIQTPKFLLQQFKYLLLGERNFEGKHKLKLF